MGESCLAESATATARWRRMSASLSGPFMPAKFARNARRIAHMDETGIAVQVLSLTSPGVQVFEAALATRLPSAWRTSCARTRR